MFRSLFSLLLLSVLICTMAMENLKVVYKWEKLDFQFLSEEDKQNAKLAGWYNPMNNLPLGLEVYQDRLFITVPRWRDGVAASLAYINLSDSTTSPKLHPYPNWNAHSFRDNQVPEIVSPFRIRADKCGRLWAIDSGYKNVIEKKIARNPSLLIYDLSSDTLLRSFTIPDDQVHPNSFFCNVVVEENNCNDSFAYLADLGHPAMIVYSFQRNRSWIIQHHYFHMDPLAGDMTIDGENFQWSDGLFGMALSNNGDGYSTLYFHPMISYNEFNVSTEVLRNEALIENSTAIFHEFKVLGSRGSKGQSGSSFYHEKSKVLFYSLLHLNAVACWRTTNPNYTIQSHGRVFMSNDTMIFPSDLKVDRNNVLWVLSNRLPTFLYDRDRLSDGDFNFRILNSSVADAIRGTACDSTMVMNPKIIETIGNVRSGSMNYSKVVSVQIHALVYFVVLFAIIFR